MTSAPATAEPRVRRLRGPRHVHVAIIGAGFTGLAMVHALREAGIEDWLVIEQAPGVGGTWRHNTYPGIACDIPSHLYCLSFAPNLDWESTFPTGRQIWEYAERVARDLRIAEQARFGERLLDARWDEGRSRWRLRTTTLELSADVVVDGSGALAEPAYPAISGLERFTGTLVHSARWNPGLSLAGKRVGVIGTGASAAQIVPAIQPDVTHLKVFQRTPGWVIPRYDRQSTQVERDVLHAVPLLAKLMRAGQYACRDGLLLRVLRHRRSRAVLEALSKAYLRRAIADPQLRAKLTPRFEVGCKRILVSSTWYPALNQPNVDVESSPVSEIREHAVLTADGAEHVLDAVVCATGFHVTDPPAAAIFHGRDGRSLAETWGAHPRAYRGLTTANFPNLFRVGSVGTATGHMSHIMQIESAVAYVVDALRTLQAYGLASVEVTEDAQEAYARRVHAMVKDSVWATGCRSWYLDARGEPSAIWPSSAWHYRAWTRRFDLGAYRVRPRVSALAAHAVTSAAPPRRP